MKKRIIMYSMILILTAFLIAGGSYAFWSFSSANKTFAFNTASNLRKYIDYDSGESNFSGSLQVGEDFSYGIHSTISVSKSNDASRITLVGTIYMDVNAIGPNMSNSRALKWTLTKGDATNVGEVLAQGNFVGASAGDVLTLYPTFEVLLTTQKFTVWIWLDKSENPSEALSGETLDTNVWTEINQVEGVDEQFNITQINANYQVITATAVNNMHDIDGYKVTTSNTPPSSWETITNPGKVYNLPPYSNTQAGVTYYVWFKDTEGHKTSDSVTVSAVDNTPPSCTWGTFDPSTVYNGQTSTISLTCTDSGSGIANSDIKVTDISVKDANNNNSTSIVVDNISKASTTNGYIYTLTVTGNSTGEGTAKLVLAENTIRDGTQNGNASTSSGYITISNVVTVTVQAGNGISKVALTGWTNTGTATMTKSLQSGSTLDLSTITPTYKTGYSGISYTKTSGSGSISGNTFTVGTGAATITLNATTIASPTCAISGGATKVYNYQATTLTATNSTSYDTGVTLAYQFGYATSSTGTLGNFANGTNNTYSVAKAAYRGTRYYGAKITATGDGGLSASCATASGSYTEMALVNARIDFDASTNGGTISGTTPLYVGYGATNIYTGRTNTTAGTIPTATKTGYTFTGWYTQVVVQK